MRLAHRRPGLLPGLALVALACLSFLPAVWSSFVSDDLLLVHNLRHAHGLWWAFGRNDAGEAGAAGHFYRPVWTLWNLGLFRVFGASAVAFHFGNLLLYAVTVLEVWVLAARLADPRRAWVAAAVFAVYPRHGESVAWVSGNTDLTAVAVGLGALLCATTVRWPLAARVLGAAALTAVATLCKEIAFVLPALALLLLWRRRTRREELLMPGAMLAVEAGTFAVRWVELGGLGGYSDYPWKPLRSAGVAGSYAIAALTPPSVETFRYPVVLVVPALIVAVAAWRAWRRPERLVLVGLAWFAISIAPLLNLAVDLNNANGERLMLLASVGLALALAGLLPPAGGSPGWPSSRSRSGWRSRSTARSTGSTPAGSRPGWCGRPSGWLRRAGSSSSWGRRRTTAPPTSSRAETSARPSPTGAPTSRPRSAPTSWFARNAPAPSASRRMGPPTAEPPPGTRRLTSPRCGRQAR